VALHQRRHPGRGRHRAEDDHRDGQRGEALVDAGDAGQLKTREAADDEDHRHLGAEDRLRGLIGPSEGQTWTPTDRPTYRKLALAGDVAWQQADVARPDLRLARVDVERQDLLARQAELLGKPQLDLTARANTNNQGPDFGQALAALPAFRYVDVQAGVVLSVPLGPNALADEVEKARLRQVRAAAVRSSAEHNAKVAVRLALRDLELAAKRYEATRLARTLADRSLAAERKKLGAGLTTAFQVLVVQGNADQAALSENRAVIQHLQARARLTRALGS
jgi:outer membrane protein TolC